MATIRLQLELNPYITERFAGPDRQIKVNEISNDGIVVMH